MDSNTREESDARSGIQVIARAASILKALKNENDGLSLGQIAERVDLPRSTVQRIVGALQSEQFVIAASPDRGIRLGPQLAALAEAAKIDMTEKLRPFLTDLGKRTKETVDLAVLRGKRLIFIDQIPGTHRLRTVSQVGETFPLTDTANGKACLAKLGEKERAAIFANEDVTGDNATRLLEELDQVRETGLAYDRDEHTDGISAVGAAFFDRQGDLYAISLPTPSSRFKHEEGKIAEHLLQTLKQIERLELVNVRR